MRSGSARLQWVVRFCLVVCIAVGAFGLAATACAETRGSKQRAVSTPPASGKLGDRWTNPEDGQVLVYLPAGEFIMGSTRAQVDAAIADKQPEVRELWRAVFEAEMPQRRVQLSAYWIGRTPVTVAQYRRFCAATGKVMPSRPYWGWKADHPIVHVSWDDAKAYCDWAGLVLPTEAQWEKAARGTDGRAYPCGNTFDAAKCVCSVVGRRTSTEPVGSMPSGASIYGCLDMAGNVWQWCSDWYDEKYYATAPSRNPTGPASGSGRSLRGGSWYSYAPGDFRAACRNYLLVVDPTYRGSDDGFRCVSRQDPG